MHRRHFLLGAAAALAGSASRPARACGAMVFHPEQPGRMSDQQVLIAHDDTKVVEVVSVGYADAKGEFAFLLPLPRKPVTVRDGDQQLFAALEYGCAPIIDIVDGTRSSSGGGCCVMVGGAGAPRGDSASSVVVVARGETKTYTYAIVGGDGAESVGAWLEREGFPVSEHLQGSLDRYLTQGWLFLAAKLKAEQPEGNLAPLELHFEPMPVEALRYPLAMSAGAVPEGKRVAITLYLAGAPSGPNLPANYSIGRIANEELRALSPTTSNYDQLFAVKTQAGGWLMEFGGKVATADIGSWRERVAPAPTGPEVQDALRAIFAEEAALVRLRGSFAGPQLLDLELKRVAAVDHPRFYHVTWGGQAEARLLDRGAVSSLALGVLAAAALGRRQR